MKNLDVQSANLKALNFSVEGSAKDGEPVKIPNQKELGHSDFYSVGIKHSPNGHSFAIYNDREYSIYKS